MSTVVADLERYQALADAGQYAALAGALQARPADDVAASAALSLLYGTARARIGQLDEGARWVEHAVARARQEGACAVERRALNARGGIAFLNGRLDDAADYFTQGLMAASRDGDFAAVARCSNNIGSVSSLRGRHAEAISSYQMAIAAFERSGLRRGVAECRHNLGITYGQQGEMGPALAAATQAAADAEAAGDRGLAATAYRGRAELYVRSGDLAAARSDIEGAVAAHQDLGDPLEQAQDQRIVAALLAAEGQLPEAEEVLRDVIHRAEALSHPQLVGEASRDLALLLLRIGRRQEAQSAARAARAIFARLGAEHEQRKLAGRDWEGDFAAELRQSLAPLHEAQRLADAGRYVELDMYLQTRTPEELQSPTLALLYGIAHARLARLDAGQQWATVALTRARTRGDRAIEVRALNVCGAIALERGGISEATQFFTRAQQEALQQGDLATVGRAANNLGIIANMQGDYDRAVSSYTMAIAAYQRVGLERGVAESEHNLGIAYRDQGKFADALQAADDAVRDAHRLGDRALMGQALAGRAEIRAAAGDPALAAIEAERALAIHRELGDEVRETEDLRILAVALGLLGDTARSVGTLAEVVRRATEHHRPLLAAIAQRDLAQVQLRAGQRSAARDAALDARSGLRRLGASVEVAKLDELLTALA